MILHEDFVSDAVLTGWSSTPLPSPSPPTLNPSLLLLYFPFLLFPSTYLVFLLKKKEKEKLGHNGLFGTTENKEKPGKL